MDKEGLFVNYEDKLRQSMSLMEILLVLPFDGAAIIHITFRSTSHSTCSHF